MNKLLFSGFFYFGYTVTSIHDKASNFFLDDVVYSGANQRKSATTRAAVGASIAGFLILLLVALFLWRMRKAGGIRNMKLMPREEDRAIPLNPFTAKPSSYSAVMAAATKANLPNYASLGSDPNLGPSSSNQPLTRGTTPPDDQVAAGPSRFPPGQRPRPSVHLQRQSSASALSSAPSYRTIDRSSPRL